MSGWEEVVVDMLAVEGKVKPINITVVYCCQHRH